MLENVLVREWMTSPVLTVTPGTPISNAHQLMRQNSIRRLPVLDREGALVGIITLGDIREAKPSDATSLSIWEVNYLWAQLTVDRVMTRVVITIEPDDCILTAAEIMLDKKISGLPVVDKAGKLVGILTESDIFKMLVKSRTKALTTPG